MQQQQPLSGSRILIVEDEALVSLDHATLVRRMGGEVVGPARELQQAMRYAEQEALDGVVLDVGLRGELAYDVAATLRRRGVPFIFVTGYSERAMPEQWRSSPRLDKPFGHERLREALISEFRAQSRTTRRPF